MRLVRMHPLPAAVNDVFINQSIMFITVAVVFLMSCIDDATDPSVDMDDSCKRNADDIKSYLRSNTIG